MEDAVRSGEDVGERGGGIGRGEIMAHGADARGGHLRNGPSAKRRHVVAERLEPPTDRTADETAPAGDDRFHAWLAASVPGPAISMASCVAAQIASQSASR